MLFLRKLDFEGIEIGGKMTRKKLIQSIENAVKVNKKLFVAAIILQVALLFFMLVKPLLYQAFLDKVLVEQKWNLLQWLFLGYLSLAFLDMFGKLLAVKVKNKLFFSALLQIRRNIWKSFAGESVEQVAKNSGDKKLRMDEDAEKVCNIYYSQKIDYVVQLGIAICSMAFMVTTEWHLSLMAILCIPVTVGLSNYLGKKEQVLTETNRINSEKINDWIKRDMTAWKQKKLLQTEQADSVVFRNYLGQYADFFSHWINYWTLRCLVIPQLKNEFVMQLGVYLLGGYFISKGTLEIGGLLVFIIYYNYFVSAIQEISDRKAEILEGYPSVIRALELLKNNEIQNKNQITVPIERITVQNLCFTYDSKVEENETYDSLQQEERRKNGNAVLDHANLKIERGNMFQLRGKSGSGKSTLLSVLAKIYPYQEGSILLNDAIELSDIPSAEWYQKISCEMQDMTLFPETIRENLYYAKPDASEQQMMDALQAADAWEFVAEMEQGMDTKLSENGSNLSGGQRQRLLLARTLLKPADIYFLDEPTSALDLEREKRVMDVLTKLAKEKIVFLITHRE